MYIFKIPNNKNFEVVPYISENLITNRDAFDLTKSQLVINAGFFDPSNKKTTSNIQNGQTYKNSVKDNFIAKLIRFPLKIEDILIKNFQLQKTIVDTYIENLLSLNDLKLIEYNAYNYLKSFIEEKDL